MAGISNKLYKTLATPNYTSISAPDDQLANDPYETVSRLRTRYEEAGQTPPQPSVLKTGLDTALKVLDAPGNAVRGLISEGLPGLGKGLLEQKRYSTEDWFKQGGMQKGIARTALGFLGDVLLDPTTYIGGGAVKGMTEAAKGGLAVGKAAEKAGARLAETTAAKTGVMTAEDIIKKYGGSSNLLNIAKNATGKEATGQNVAEFAKSRMQGVFDASKAKTTAERGLNVSVGRAVGEGGRMVDRDMATKVTDYLKEGTYKDPSALNAVIGEKPLTTTAKSSKAWKDLYGYLETQYGNIVDPELKKKLRAMSREEAATLVNVSQKFGDVKDINFAIRSAKSFNNSGMVDDIIKQNEVLQGAVSGLRDAKVEVTFANGLKSEFDKLGNMRFIGVEIPFTKFTLPLADVSKITQPASDMFNKYVYANSPTVRFINDWWRKNISGEPTRLLEMEGLADQANGVKQVMTRYNQTTGAMPKHIQEFMMTFFGKDALESTSDRLQRALTYYIESGVPSGHLTENAYGKYLWGKLDKTFLPPEELTNLASSFKPEELKRLDDIAAQIGDITEADKAALDKLAKDMKISTDTMMEVENLLGLDKLYKNHESDIRENYIYHKYKYKDERALEEKFGTKYGSTPANVTGRRATAGQTGVTKQRTAYETLAEAFARDPYIDIYDNAFMLHGERMAVTIQHGILRSVIKGIDDINSSLAEDVASKVMKNIPPDTRTVTEKQTVTKTRRMSTKEYEKAVKDYTTGVRSSYDAAVSRREAAERELMKFSRSAVEPYGKALEDDIKAFKAKTGKYKGMTPAERKAAATELNNRIAETKASGLPDYAIKAKSGSKDMYAPPGVAGRPKTGEVRKETKYAGYVPTGMNQADLDAYGRAMDEYTKALDEEEKLLGREKLTRLAPRDTRPWKIDMSKVPTTKEYKAKVDVTRTEDIIGVEHEKRVEAQRAMNATVKSFVDAVGGGEGLLQFKQLFRRGLTPEEIASKEFVKVDNMSQIAGDYYAHRDIMPHIEKFNAMVSGSQGMNQLLEAYDTGIRWLKQLQTTANPTFAPRNALGETMMSVLHGTTMDSFHKAQDVMNNLMGSVKIGSKSMFSVEAMNLLKAMRPTEEITVDGVKSSVADAIKRLTEKNSIDIAGKPTYIEDIFNDFLRRGLGTSGIVSDVFLGDNISKLTKRLSVEGKFKSLKAVGKQLSEDMSGTTLKSNPASGLAKAYMGVQRSAAEYTEVMTRLSDYIEDLGKGMTPEQAALNVKAYHVDYADLTVFEKKYLRRLVPYYTFMRKNIPIQLRLIVEKPMYYSMLGHLMNSANSAFGNPTAPEYLRENLALPIHQDEDGNITYLNWNLPITDLARFSNSWQENFRQAMGSMSPLVKLIPEMASGENMAFGTPIKSVPQYAVNQLGVVNTLYKALQGANAQGETGTYARPGQIPLYGSMLPQANPNREELSRTYKYRDELLADMAARKAKGQEIPALRDSIDMAKSAGIRFTNVGSTYDRSAAYQNEKDRQWVGNVRFTP